MPCMCACAVPVLCLCICFVYSSNECGHKKNNIRRAVCWWLATDDDACGMSSRNNAQLNSRPAAFSYYYYYEYYTRVFVVSSSSSVRCVCVVVTCMAFSTNVCIVSNLDVYNITTKTTNRTFGSHSHLRRTNHNHTQWLGERVLHQSLLDFYWCLSFDRVNYIWKDRVNKKAELGEVLWQCAHHTCGCLYMCYSHA